MPARFWNPPSRGKRFWHTDRRIPRTMLFRRPNCRGAGEADQPQALPRTSLNSRTSSGFRLKYRWAQFALRVGHTSINHTEATIESGGGSVARNTPGIGKGWAAASRDRAAVVNGQIHFDDKSTIAFAEIPARRIDRSSLY